MAKLILSTHNNRHFRGGRGKPTFTCAICERLTRDTGQGVDHLCHECYDICGIDNRINDGGNSAETRAKYADESDRLLAKIVKLGGNGERVKKQNSFVWPGK